MPIQYFFIKYIYRLILQYNTMVDSFQKAKREKVIKQSKPKSYIKLNIFKSAIYYNIIFRIQTQSY